MKAYLNTCENAESIGWHYAPRRCKGDVRARFVLVKEGCFRFVDRLPRGFVLVG